MYKIILIIISGFIISNDFLEKIPSKDYNGWKPLNKGRVTVSYSNYLDINWGHARAVFPIRMDKIYDALHDLENYNNIFDRITESKILDNEENVVLDYNHPEQTNYELWPYDKEFFIILNLAIGGTWGGINGIDNDSFPQYMYIDYVKVSELRCSEN